MADGQLLRHVEPAWSKTQKIPLEGGHRLKTPLPTLGLSQSGSSVNRSIHKLSTLDPTFASHNQAFSARLILALLYGCLQRAHQLPLL